MIDVEKRNTKFEQKEKVRRRVRVEIDPDNYEYIPEKKKADFYDTETDVDYACGGFAGILAVAVNCLVADSPQ